MFGLFKREDPNRRAMRIEFETVTRQLRTADLLAQTAVGHSINLAHSLFRKRFTVAKFQSLPNREQIDYIDSLSGMETKLQSSDPPASVGIGLFKMWVGAVAAADEALMRQFAEELSYFSQRGDMSELEAGE